jgi:hypothetical protein
MDDPAKIVRRRQQAWGTRGPLCAIRGHCELLSILPRADVPSVKFIIGFPQPPPYEALTNEG